MAYARLEHQGGAILTTLASDISSGDTSMTLTASTNWPTGTNPFYLVIDPGLSNEEKILATARSTNSLTGLTCGVDGTSAAAHTAGAVVKHIFTAVEADEANATAKATLGTVTTKGDVLVATASQTLARQGVGANATVMQADSAQTNGLKWGTIDATSFSAATAGNGLSISTTALRVNTDNTTIGIAADTLQIVNSGVDTLQLATGAVTSTKLADDAVITAKIGDAQVTNAKMAANSVDTVNIVPGTILASDLSSTIFGAGSDTDTPSGGTGAMVCTHGCAFTPSAVVATVHSPVGGSTALVCVAVDNIGATTFQAHIYNVDAGAYYTAAPVTLYFVCLP